MKTILSILIFLVAMASIAQTKTLIPPTGTPNGIYHYPSIFSDSVQLFPTGSGYPSIDMTNYLAKVRLAGLQFDSANHIFWYFDPSTGVWDTLQSTGGGGGGGGEIIPGGAFVTSNVEIGFNPGTNLTAAEIIKKVWYGTQPIATLTGGTTLEFTSSPTVSQTLNWGATRQVGAVELATIVVAGVSQSFSQPAEGGTVNGTQGVNVPANVTTIYQNIVTADDGQTATASTTFNFLGRRYYGVVSDTTGIGSGTQDAVILALTNSFATTKTLSVSTGSITGTQFWVYAYPATLGALSSLLFNSIPALEAMNTTTRSFTNSLGYSQNYIFYWNKQGQTVQSDITAQ